MSVNWIYRIVRSSHRKPSPAWPDCGPWSTSPCRGATNSPVINRTRTYFIVFNRSIQKQKRPNEYFYLLICLATWHTQRTAQRGHFAILGRVRHPLRPGIGPADALLPAGGHQQVYSQCRSETNCRHSAHFDLGTANPELNRTDGIYCLYIISYITCTYNYNYYQQLFM